MARALVEAAGADRWRDLRVRAASAVTLGPAALACVWVGDSAYLVMVALAATVLAVEWVHLCGLKAAALPGLAVPVAIIAAASVAARDRAGAGLGVLALGCLLAWAASQAARRAAAARPAPVSLAAGVAYVGVSAVALIWLRGPAYGHDGRLDVLFVFLVVWTTDIVAYAGGRLIGGPKLAPRISPGKTWSGALCGLGAAAAAGLLFALVAHDRLWVAALIAAALSCVAQLGDLAESLMKRRFGVKDTGRIIPGHGGLLDRMDGVLAAAPAAALLALALGRGLVF